MTGTPEIVNVDDIQPAVGEVMRGHYKLPHPETGKPGTYTRVSNFKEILSDKGGLERWEKRVILQGLAARPDLYLRACGAADDTRELDAVIRDAKEAGGGSVGANHGTGVHGLINAYDRGLPVHGLPVYQRKVELYVEALRGNGLTPQPQFMERILFNTVYDLAGRMDGVVREAGRDDFILIDVKTQKDFASGWGEPALQLATYANSPWMLRADPTWDDAWESAPNIRKDKALIFWIPIRPAKGGDPDPDFCEIIEVDIARAWEHAAPLAAAVREWRKEQKRTGGLAQPYRPITYTPRSVTVTAAESSPLALIPDYPGQIRHMATMEGLLRLRDLATRAGAWTEELNGLAAVRAEEILADRT